jgi:hypothetical protein
MNTPIRTCFLFDKYGQQAGPFTVAEALRLLELAAGDAPQGRCFSVWNLGWPARLSAPLARPRLLRDVSRGWPRA